MRTWARSAMIVAGLLAGGAAFAQDATPTRRLVPVTPSSGFIEPADVSAALAQKAAAVRLPVLIPAEFLRYRSLDIVSSGPYDYTASVRTETAKLSISGSRQVIDPPAGSETATPVAPQGNAGFEDMSAADAEPVTVSLSFTLNGPGYVITAECSRPRDTRCSDAALAGMRGTLRQVMVGGPPATEADTLPAVPPAPPPAVPLAAAAGFQEPFAFKPPGDLIPGSGKGSKDATVFAPGVTFPVGGWSIGAPRVRIASYANSQVWMKGGGSGPPGSWKDPSNFHYPWRDNFCEARSRATPSCPSGRGHQGQDIRVVDGAKEKYWTVATEDGTISNVGVYSVELTGISGTRYRYLHVAMKKLKVRQGQKVKAGDPIGLVSNEFGGTPTPVHLHFEILQNVGGRGLRQVPPYMSLVRAYERSLATR